MTPDPALAARIERLTGKATLGWTPASGGYSPAARWIVELAGGATVFAKAATNEETATWLRTEHITYTSVRGSFLADVCGWDDDGVAPLLLLEDLSAAHWPPPWTPERVQRVLDTLDRIHASPAPAALPDLTALAGMFNGWTRVAADPEPFLQLGLCSRVWLERALADLVDAEAAVDLDGDALLHLDVRSDNMCLLGERTILVDWNWACRGNANMDLAFWAPSLHVEGGPAPQDVLRNEPQLAAVVSGFFAYSAGQPPLHGTGDVRGLQRRQLEAALPWAAHALGLAPPL